MELSFLLLLEEYGQGGAAPEVDLRESRVVSGKVCQVAWSAPCESRTQKEERMTIRELREKAGWSPAQFADLVGVSVQTVDHWERGLLQPDDKQLRVLGEVFQVPSEEIVLQDPIEQE